MISANRVLFWFTLDRRLLQFLLIAATSTASVVMGLVPSIHTPTATISFSSAASAQSISDDEIVHYARSVLAIEPIRQATYNRIKNEIGSVPEIACHRPSSLSSLDSRIRQDAVDYCNQAISIVESNNLTISRFNEITVAHQSNQSLSERIRQALLQLQ
ncbi:MAG TPA: DUF4168 domain-containing protein [Trichocoleus sp.]|jgi:hypothetical protein